MMASLEVSAIEVDVDSQSSEEESSDLAAVTAKVTSSLQKAQPAAVSRQRTLLVNPSGARKRQRCGPSTKLQRKSLHDCVKQYPGEHLVVDAGVLFCGVCRTQVSQKASSLLRHISSARHAEGKKAKQKHKETQQSITTAMRQFNAQTHVKGETLPETERAYRCEVVQAFLRAGVPLSKLKHFRTLLEKGGTRLADPSVLARQCIPTLLSMEKDDIKQATAGRPVAVIYDGSTRLGEALAVLFRFSDDEWSPKQVLVRLKVLAKSLTGEQLAGELIHVLSTSLQVQQANLVATMRDGASVNGCALKVVRAIYPTALDVTCFSHAIDLTGSHFELPTLDLFMQHWIRLFSHSATAKLRWKERTGVAMRSFSATRWWSKWEVMDQALSYFGDIEPFLEENDDIAPRTSDHIRALLMNVASRKKLIMELAAVVDAGKPFVQATYALEGDGLLVFSAYATLQGLSTAAHQRHYPNVDAQAQKLADSPQEEANLQQHARACVRPGVDFFVQKFNVQFYRAVRAFKAARYACPQKVQQLKPTAVDVNALREFPFLDSDATIGALQQELPTYIAEADGVVVEDGQQMVWWRNQSVRLPHWSDAARKLSLVQPSSAAAERVFSLLKANFSKQQHSVLEDELEAALMLAYNHRLD